MPTLFTAVIPPIRFLFPSNNGLRLLARARFSGSDPDESSSIGGGDCTRPAFLRAAERVVGPKYPSFSFVSDGVGDGEITRGVCGIWYCLDELMACGKPCGKEGSGEVRMKPVSDRRVFAQKWAMLSSNERLSGGLGGSVEAERSAS